MEIPLRKKFRIELRWKPLELLTLYFMRRRRWRQISVVATTAAAAIAKKSIFMCNYVLWCVCEFVAHSHLPFLFLFLVFALSILLSPNMCVIMNVNFSLYHTTHTSGHCNTTHSHPFAPIFQFVVLSAEVLSLKNLI